MFIALIFFCYYWLACYFADNTKLESEDDILACTTSIQRGLDKLGVSQQKPWEVQQGERTSFVCGTENPRALVQAGNWLADKQPCWKVLTIWKTKRKEISGIFFCPFKAFLEPHTFTLKFLNLTAI